MARRRRGGLSEEDQALWRQVAATAQPLHPEKSHTPPHGDPVPKPSEPRQEPRAAFDPFRVGERAQVARPHDIAPAIGERLRSATAKMDRRAFDTMLRGRLNPESRLDLHGLTLAEAHPALVRFVLSGHGRGLRLLLVITGKGKSRADDGPIPARPGALRHQVPHWLALAPLASLVLQVTPAHIRHGGGGAYYVYLRRKR